MGEFSSMKKTIRYADITDLEYLSCNDKHIRKELINKKINDKEIIMIHYDKKTVGWLRYNYFWDNIPFMNMLFIEDEFRRIGLGTKALNFWENEMKRNGHKLVMTSTLANENAQFFYRKQGYEDSGCLLLEDEPLEILFVKKT